MIHEPTGWEADCDLWSCKATEEQSEQVDGLDDWVHTLRQYGWIVLDEWSVFHSLDCLLLKRSSADSRKHMGDVFAIHAKYRHDGSVCCPEHGKHVTDGEHTYPCPQRRLSMASRGVAL